MLKSKSSLGLMALVLLLALAVPALWTSSGSGYASGNARAEGGDWKNVTVLYSTDCKGKIEPCG